MLSGFRRRLSARVLMIMFVSLAFIHGAEGQEKAEPDGYGALVRVAVKAYEARDYVAARSLFEHAHHLYPNARTLRGIGIVALEQGDYVLCATSMEAALSSTERSLDEGLRREAQGLLTRMQTLLGRVAVTVEPATARLFIDGKPWTASLGTAPVYLAPGPHAFRFEQKDYIPDEQSLSVRAGEQQTIRVTLLPVRPLPVIASAPPGRKVERLDTRPIVAVKRETSRTFSVVERPTRAPLYRNPWLWGGVSLAVVTAVVVSVVAARGGATVREREPVTTGNAATGGILIALERAP
jgi:hypothetical protein